MTGTRETVLQSCRGWLKGSLALTDDQVIPADDKGPRPSIPYLTVKLIAHGLPRGVDEEIRGVDGGGAPTVKIIGQRVSTLSVQGFGGASAEWLELAALRLRRPDVIALCDTLAITVEAEGGIDDVSAMIDTEIEPRYACTFEVSYAHADDAAATQTEAIDIVADLTYPRSDTDGDPLTEEITITP